uniref:Biotin/lipoate A/B protein ligase family n=1 Tax=uncultured marine type-A Synechococcus 5B2 TaxID=359140 RepID=Q0QM18_9SYNE|nr:biotin/lipoate A/B protein ligase family [uncultured marine type-A Synechococcus 5B2]
MPTAGQPGRIIPSLCSNGRTQMGIDALLLQQAAASPVLRFYRWEGAWLSLGRHQHRWPRHWNRLQTDGLLKLVRRPSGGQAVLHAGGLTYALIWPNAPRKRREAYRQACQWLINGFATLGLPLRFGDAPTGRDDPNCFARSTAADLVDCYGVKRIGSAQRWQRGHLLQHGEILLDPPNSLWQEVFGTEAPKAAPSTIRREPLETHLQAAMASTWPGVIWEERPLSGAELQLVECSLEQFSLADSSEEIGMDATI